MYKTVLKRFEIMFALPLYSFITLETLFKVIPCTSRGSWFMNWNCYHIHTHIHPVYFRQKSIHNVRTRVVGPSCR